MNESPNHRCMICGYLYQDENGDPSSEVPEGTAWEQLPENWTCPMCGADKNEFELLS